MAATDMDGHTTVATTITERGLLTQSPFQALTPRLNLGMYMDGHTTEAIMDTITERGQPMLSLPPMPMLNPSHGGMAATDMDGHTTVATTITERGLPMPSLLPMPMLNPSHGGTEAMDMDGHTTATTGVELMGSIQQYSLTKAFTKDKHYENRTFNKLINF